MKKTFLILSASLLMPLCGFAADPIVGLQVVSENGPETVNVETYLAETPEDAERIIEHVNADTRNELKANPSLQMEVLAEETQSHRIAREGDPSLPDPAVLATQLESSPQAARKAVELRTRAFDFLKQKGYQITLSVGRGYVNGRGVYKALLLSDVPAPIAIGVGIVAGSMSGTLQLLNSKYQTWLKGKGWLKPHLDEANGIVAGKGESLGKWMALEYGFLAVVKAAVIVGATLVGAPELIPADPAEFANMALRLCLTSALATGAQGSIDVINASWTKKNLLKGRRGTQLISDVVTSIVSVVATGLSVMDMEGYLPVKLGPLVTNIGQIGLVVIGTGGFVYLFKDELRRSKERIRRYLVEPVLTRRSRAACAGIFAEAL